MESPQKFRVFYLNHTSPADKPYFLELIKQSLKEDEYREFLMSPNDLSWRDKIFYHAINGSYSATIMNSIVSFLRQTKQTILISDSFVRNVLQKRI
ncbi:MAG: hypothetical protein LBL62_07645 [Planctomycetaceae bacterium]|nr:hypothetical protein [Planctomycetaceae bacterium]